LDIEEAGPLVQSRITGAFEGVRSTISGLEDGNFIRLDGRGIIVRGLARLGVYSYTIYLCHRPLSFWCVGDLTTWSPERIPIVKDHVFLFYVVLSIAAGVIMAKLIELPVLRLRDRLLPAQAGMQITAPSLHSKPIYRVMTASGSN